MTASPHLFLSPFVLIEKKKAKNMRMRIEGKMGKKWR